MASGKEIASLLLVHAIDVSALLHSTFPWTEALPTEVRSLAHDAMDSVPLNT